MTALSATSAPFTAPDELRADHLRHETALRMVGTLYYVGAALLVAGAVALAIKGGGSRTICGLAMLAAGFGAAGYLLRKLDFRARILGSFMALAGLAALPIGTVLNGYVLYLLHSKRGRTVLAPGYHDVVARTPQFQSRAAYPALAMSVILTGVTVYNVISALWSA